MRPPDSRELRDALGAFVTGVTVVTTVGNSGQPRGFTANSFTSVSLDPPLVLVCISKAALSLSVFQEATGFAVNILAENQRAISHLFATKDPRKFEAVAWSPGPAGNPVFEGAAAWVECTRHQVADGGDHVILIGRVVACGHAPVKPLVYCRGAYVTFGLEERVVAAEGGKTCIGVILERQGCVMMLKNPATGEFVLPTAASIGQPEGKEGLYGALQSLGVRADLGFLFSVFEDGKTGDVSHSTTRTCFDAIEYSSRPIAITHANPQEFVGTDIELNRRNKSTELIKRLAERKGVIGLSMYPKIMKGGSSCTLDTFLDMITWTVDRIGVDHVGFGSDFYTGWPESVIKWWRAGRWSRESAVPIKGFSPWPSWFKSPADFPRIIEGMERRGLSSQEIAKIAGGNWLRLFRESFAPARSNA